MAAEDLPRERRPGEARHHLDKRRVASAFEGAAPAYERAAVLQRRVAERMDERLPLMRIDPERILDAGAGTGTGARLLERRYPRARIVAVDLVHAMLAAAGRRRWRSRISRVCADAERLPFDAASFDLIYSNLMLQWCNDVDAVLHELRRLLRPRGLVMFSSFGPDTLRELRESWTAADGHTHVNAFVDMHDLGDALVRAGLHGPVLDVEHFTLTYEGVTDIARDLKAIGAANATAGRGRALTGKHAWRRMAEAYESHRRDGRLPATFEVVYGHAWAPTVDTRPQDGSQVAAFPVGALRGTRRS